MDDEGFQVLAFDDVEEVPWNAGMTMRPIRGRLGLRAFGAAGFRGAEPGDLVIEPHTEESGRGHEELYVVLRGRARFRLDGEDVEAPAGTMVFVPARQVAEEGLRELPSSPGVRYALALAAAAAGDRDAARQRLAEAADRVPELREVALNEPLLSDLLDV